MEPAREYTRRIELFDADRRLAAHRSRNLSHLRLVVFLILVVLLIGYVTSARFVLGLGSALTAAFFIGLVWLHARTRRREAWLTASVQLNTEGLHRLARQWSGLPVRGATADLRNHPYGEDLDLFGSASLVQLLGPTPTTFGSVQLDDWLLRPADPETILARQAAVQDLAPQIDWRDTFVLYGRETQAARVGELSAFLTWAEGEPWLSRKRWVLLVARVLPVLTWILLALQLSVWSNRWWQLSLALTLMLWLVTARRIHATFSSAFARNALLAHYPDLLRCIDEAKFTARLLAGIQTRLRAPGSAPHMALRKLERLMRLADARASSFHLPVQLLTLSDFHVLNALERWQVRYGRRAREWLQAIGEVEALTALSVLAHDHPAWAFPEIDGSADRITGEQLGHALIAASTRVDNDVTVGPAGTFVLITGSNMSGKSTLLRALGVNIVLAQAGAPVCARGLRMPPASLATSIRIQDSLARGVSYFMAELERLKSIVDAAAAPVQGRVPVYLLDELLHGTNSGERRVAARLVIRRLVDSGALGAVTTHDLDLVSASDLAAPMQAVHFREHFREVGKETVMEFDYFLRPGPAPTTNALKLVELVGLGPVDR
jgi:MutS-like protein